MDTPEPAPTPQTPPPPPWTVDYRHADARRFKKYAKRFPREAESCADNLANVLELTNAKGRPDAFHVDYFRNEFGPVWRIGQTGVPHARETRLYIYAAMIGRTFYPLTIGDKNTQQADLAHLKQIANALAKEGLQ